jgi:hypothetical protein
MKKIILCMFLALGFRNDISGQSQEVQQLLLNVEKLAQFREILSQMEKGYEVLSTGYNTIKEISQKSFDLHKAYLDGLLAVSPSVKKYGKVAAIIRMQLVLISTCNTAMKLSLQNDFPATGEILYTGKVCNRLISASLEDLGDLTGILTAGRLRMSDDERLRLIDRIYHEMQDKLVFLRRFTDRTALWMRQRERSRQDVDRMKGWYHLK